MPNITDSWGGTMIERGNSSVSRFSVGFAQAVQEFQAKTPIMLIDAPPCNNCTLTVQALGFNVRNCTERKRRYIIPECHVDDPSDYDGGPRDPFRNATFFEVAITRIAAHEEEDRSSALNVTVLRKASEACNDHTVIREYKVVPSTVEYKLFMNGQKVTFAYNNWTDDKLIQEVNYKNENVGSEGDCNTIHPLVVFGSQLMRGKSEFIRTSENYMQNHNTGLTPYLYARSPSTNISAGCWGTFDDPFDDIINAYPMGSGFWRLGRDVSLSPLELANAFFGGGGSVGGGGGAPRWMRQTDGVLSSEGISSGTLTPTSPQSDSSKSSVTVNGSDSGGYHQQQHLQHTLANILTGCSSNASADQIVKHIEKRAWAFNQADYWFDKKRIPRVQYGVDDQTGRLMFFIHGPRDGEDRKRAMVRPPVKGEKF
ncbi:unnamed protein product [Sordaria macrospora k-hell]|uniref:WGS project CABT00000000 data, contig 2.78 n=1 Tax=Sordaria macrospora (strain ATCC MYA-333 / DSM 997 / K(L3346) / K-hell) TaxID=771870 RepID=F7WBJ8_SORMK|nr:uncharacterized protein SMAC_09208 [Sordaria macrospora k-hell]CCC14427.1 unnamed protein product [Sordaria macrospora k-hell]